jgi:Restriction endonuclease
MQDLHLEKNIKSLQLAIKAWATRHNLWNDSVFKSWMEHWDDEPSEDPCILIVCSDGELGKLLHDQYDYELHSEFQDLLQKFSCYYELWDYGEAQIFVNDNEELKDAYRNYFEWQWICSLVEPDFSDLYEEIYAWFHRYPDDLYHLDPRKFEVLLDGVFRNNGFQTRLGSGQADGGVDIRLYSNDVIGEVVTLVQAKRYAVSNPIDLQAVQALSAAVEDERANQGLFVTTSRYLPCAKNFAARQNKRIKLATSDDVSLWSAHAVERIIRDKSQLIKPTHLQFLLDKQGLSNTLEGKIFHARWGATMILNSFAIVLRESKGAALLMKLPKIGVSGDSLRGCEIPDLGIAALSYLDGKYVFRAKKKYQDNGQLYLWGDRELYSLWDGSPQLYDHLD